MRNQDDIEAIFAELLPWTDPEPPEPGEDDEWVGTVTAHLSSVRPVDAPKPHLKITVNFIQDERNIGGVQYEYDFDEDCLTATQFNAGAMEGHGLLRRYHDDSCELFLDHGLNGKTQALDPRIKRAYEAAGWTPIDGQPGMYAIKNRNQLRRKSPTVR